MPPPLDKGRWKLVAPELDQALELAPEQRAPWLEALRRRDAALAGDVERLLGRRERLVSQRFLEQEIAPPSLAGQVLGPYTLRQLVGQGGMGSVWRAERTDGRFEATAAVKLLNASLLGHAAEERLRQEGRILARLQHPNVARLLDAGVSTLGQPYLVLEYVVGEHIDAYCDARRLDVAARLRLFAQVLEAVAYAHANLVVHRDLKPSNVLVTAEGRVKLLDFGIATLVDGEGGRAVSTALTREGGRVFTPDYAAPEQILDGPVATTTDVYALGVLLTELLSGARPYRLPAGAARRDLEDAIVRQEPARPSEAVTCAAAEARRLTPRQLARRLRGDLDAIALRAIEKAPEARYRSVGALADDLERHETLRPVLARAAGRWSRLDRFVRRNRAPLALALALAATLSTATVVALGQARRANAEAEGARRAAARADAEAEGARRAAARADAVQGFLVDIFQANTASQDDPVKARATTARELLDLGARRVDGALDGSPEAKLALLELLSKMYVDLGLDDEAVALARRASEQTARRYGERDARTAKALLSLSAALHGSNSLAERDQVLDRAEAVVTALPESEVALRAELEQNRFEQRTVSAPAAAADHARRAVELRRRAGDADELGNALLAMGQLYADVDRPHDAIASYREGLALLERSPRNHARELVMAYTYLAESEQAAFDNAGAERHFEEALERALRLQGPAHVDVVQTRLRYGVFLVYVEQFARGLAQLEQAQRLALQLRGEDDEFHVPTARGEYGHALATFGDPSAGLRALKPAVENRRANLPGSVALVQLLRNEAYALIELAQLDQAQARLDEVDQIRQGSTPTPVAGVYTALARAKLLLHRSRVDEAQALLTAVDTGLDPANPDLRKISPPLWLARAELALAQGDLEAASRQAERVGAALPADERYFGEQRARLDRLRGEVSLARGAAAEALPWLRKSAERARGLYHPGSLVTADALVALARGLLALRRADEARALHGEALAMHARHPTVPAIYRLPLEALGGALRRGG